MLKNKYFLYSLFFILLNIISLLVGKVLTYVDWAIILFLLFDRYLDNHSYIPFIVVVGFINDFFGGFYFGTTSLIFIFILLIRFIIINNFNFYELKKVRISYYLISIFTFIFLNYILNSILNSTIIFPFIYKFVLNSIFLYLFKYLVELKNAF